MFGGCVRSARTEWSNPMKKNEDVCGCCGRGLPPPKPDQSLIETTDWPIITPEMIAKQAEKEETRPKQPDA
jgi:hypothetical protein